MSGMEARRARQAAEPREARVRVVLQVLLHKPTIRSTHTGPPKTTSKRKVKSYWPQQQAGVRL